MHALRLTTHRIWLLSIVAGLIAVAVFAAILFWPHPQAAITTYAGCVAAGYPVLETDPPICRVGAHSFVGPLKGLSSPQPAIASVPFDILVTGDTANVIPAHMQTDIENQQNGLGIGLRFTPA